jgi:2-dehydropantoate 2-reductase
VSGAPARDHDGHHEARPVWVVGAGGIGCAIASRLARRHPVTIVDSWAAHVDAIRASGLTVDFPEETISVNPNAIHLSDVGASDTVPDVVLLAVKSFQTVDTVRAIAPILPLNSVVVSLQNGINEEDIASIVGSDRTIGAMVRFDGALLGPGHSRSLQRERRLTIGELNGVISARVLQLAKFLGEAVPTMVTGDIWAELWSKLCVNCEVNAVAAITGYDLGEIAKDPRARRIALALGREAVAVALALGIHLDERELSGPPASYLEPLDGSEFRRLEESFVSEFGPLADVKPSMLQDVEKGRPTEINFMNGFILRKSREVGVAVPLNEAIVDLMHRLESVPGGFKQPGPSALDSIASATC